MEPHQKAKITWSKKTWCRSARRLLDQTGRMLPAAVGMGLCQSIMLMPLLMYPIGTGAGLSVWGQPLLSTVFFAAVAATMLANEVASVGKLANGRYRELDTESCVAFSLGLMLLGATQVLPGVYGNAAGLVGASLSGYGTACAQLTSARRLAMIKIRWCLGIVTMATGISALVLVASSLVPGTFYCLAAASFPPIALGLKRYETMPQEALAASNGDNIEVLGSVTRNGALRAGFVTGCTTALAVLVLFACSGMHAATEADSGIEIKTILELFGTVAMLMTATCLAAKTLSMTLLFRISLPCLLVTATIVAIEKDAAVAMLPSELVTLCAAVPLVFIDQVTWITTASFMRSSSLPGESTASRLRMLQYTSAAAAMALSPTLLDRLGPPSALFIGVTIVSCAFVLAIPTHEARLLNMNGSQAIAGTLNREIMSRHIEDFQRYGLTNREAEVACLMIEGLDAPEMASRLVVSRATINTHVRHIYEKTRTHCRKEMLALFEEIPQRSA